MAKIKQKIKIEYFFIWGNYPALALAEILSAFNRWNIRYSIVHASIEACVITLDQYLPEEFMDQLGGTIKIGQIIEEQRGKTVDPEIIASYIIKHQPEGKIFFGLSQYRLNHLSKELTKKTTDSIGKEVKVLLKDSRSIRWVTSKEKNLSSVVVKKNKLIGVGSEIVLLFHSNKVWIGKTTAVQPFEAYGERDYGRVVTDAKVGMLPPKLAQMMLNISGAKPNEIILDPFCGFGTVLQEAMLMGWKHVVGSDIAKTSVDGTKKNLLWLKKKHQLKSHVIRIFHSDARAISEHVRGGYISTIVTEPHLGPALRQKSTKKEAVAKKKELEALYYSTFLDLTKFLRTGARVVIVWPVFILSSATPRLIYIDLLEKLEKLGFSLAIPFEKEIKKYRMGGQTTRDTLIYGRPQQKVWREILVFIYTKKEY